MFRIGHGIDIHRFQSGRPLILGGVRIDHKQGLVGHSDADVVLHAVCDALLGSLALGDLGKFFPSDEKNKDRDSLEILHETVRMVWDKGYQVGNVDCTVMAQAPKLAPHVEEMAENIARVLNIEPHCVSVKATTSEGMGFVGRQEGIECHAVVLVQKRENGV